MSDKAFVAITLGVIWAVGWLTYQMFIEPFISGDDKEKSDTKGCLIVIAVIIGAIATIASAGLGLGVVLLFILAVSYMNDDATPRK
jgi:nitric oxide reductase large subunit